MAAGRPAILFFQAWTTYVNVVGERYLFTPGHLDTEVEIHDVETGLLVTSTVIGDADVSPVVLGLTLVEGRTYRARLRYQDINSTWGPWSENAYATVPIEFGLATLATPGEPASGGTLPIQPTLPVTATRRRPMVRAQMETGHEWRRARNLEEERSVSLRFGPLTKAEHDTLLAFLTARILFAESFMTGVPDLGDRAYFARAGAYEVTQIGPGQFVVELEADEVRA